MTITQVECRYFSRYFLDLIPKFSSFSQTTSSPAVWVLHGVLLALDIFSEHPHFANFLGVPCCLRMSAVVPMCVGKQSCLHNLPPTVTPDRYFKTSVPYPLHASQPRRG